MIKQIAVGIAGVGLVVGLGACAPRPVTQACTTFAAPYTVVESQRCNGDPTYTMRYAYSDELESDDQPIVGRPADDDFLTSYANPGTEGDSWDD